MNCTNCKTDLGNNQVADKILEKLNEDNVPTFCSLKCTDEYDKDEKAIDDLFDRSNW